MPRKAQVEFVHNEEPSFIKLFKERTGMKKADDVQSKYADLDRDDDLEDRPDELPQIVLEEGDSMSEKDLNKIKLHVETSKEEEHEDEREVFTGPVYRPANQRKTKNKLGQSNEARDRSPIESMRNKKMNNTRTSSLLSFTLDDDAEDD